jgi:hypothetical protein
LLRHSTPPLVPVVNGPGDTSNFRLIRDSHESEEIQSPVDDDDIPLDVLKASSSPNPFAGFESVTIHHADQ